jgi:putative heme-binding domain-containing protein
VDSNIELEGPFTVESWVGGDPGIGNEDGILGNPGGADFNFAGGHFRVFCGPEFGDRAICRKPVVANSWTHIAVTRDSQGIIRVYQNGELDTDDSRPVTAAFKELDIGRTTPNKGTAGELTEFRVWNLARSSGDIRADFDRSLAGEPLPSGLVRYYLGAGPWRELKGAARVQKVTDAPVLLSGEQAKAQAAKFAHFRKLAQQQGDPEKGRVLFMATCGICHSIGGQGGHIGPGLDGAGASGIETLLRSILTPNAAMEAGYRTFRVELKDGDTLDGFFVSKTAEAIILRQPNAEDRRISLSEVKSADFTRNSLMPEGLLDQMQEEDAKDLFGFLKTLK